MQPDSSSTLAATAILLGMYYVLVQCLRAPTRKLRHIPTIGSSNILFSYLDAIRFFLHGQDMIQEGYNKFYGTAFKVSNMDRWFVIVSGEDMVEDLRRASEDQLSFDDGLSESIQADYTIGPQICADPYHSAVVQTTLTRNLAIRFPDIKDEIIAAFESLVTNKGDEWTSLPALSTVTEIVCRTSNRLFVGLPLCRNADYAKQTKKFAIDVVAGACIINMFPSFLRHFVGRFLTNVPASIKGAMVHLGPLIQAQMEREGKEDHADKPNDLISWLLDEAQGPQRTLHDLVVRILTINLAAIHTSSHSLTHALFYLAASPEYAEPMREEVEAVIEAEGWTKMSMGKLLKVDSFLRESHRLSASAANVRRKVVKDFTFSNGVTLPSGTHVAIAGHATHMDPNVYENPHQFKGFRFADIREEGKSTKHQFVSLSHDYLNFGTGRHACPGRFFVANLFNAILAYILLNYDIRLFNDGVRPENQWFMGMNSPNRTAQIMFRKRKT